MAAFLRFYLTPDSFEARLWRLFRSAGHGLYMNNCLSTAKGAAYSSLLSFFPVLTTMATILVQTHAEAVSRTVANFLYQVVPPGTEDVVRKLFVVHGQRPNTLLVAAVALSTWAASGAMISLMEGFHATYHIQSTRSFLQERGMAILLVFVSALPVWGASALIVFGARIFPHGFGPVLRFGIAFATVVLVAMLVYYLGPNRRQTFWHVFPGAIVATLLWSLATSVFGWYIRHVANYNLLYGSVGAGLALLVWMYVLAVIALYGCEFNAAWERAN